MIMLKMSTDYTNESKPLISDELHSELKRLRFENRSLTVQNEFMKKNILRLQRPPNKEKTPFIRWIKRIVKKIWK